MRLSRRSQILLRGGVAIALAFVYVPLIVIAIYAFNASAILHWPPTGLTLDWFSKAFHDSGARDGARPLAGSRSSPRTAHPTVAAAVASISFARSGTLARDHSLPYIPNSRNAASLTGSDSAAYTSAVRPAAALHVQPSNWIAYASSGATASNTASDAGREIMLVIDDESILPGKEAQAKEAVDKLIGSLSGRDRVGLLTLTHGGVNIGPSLYRETSLTASSRSSCVKSIRSSIETSWRS